MTRYERSKKVERIIKRSIIIISIIILIILISIILINIRKELLRKQQEKKEIEIAEQVKVEDIEIENKKLTYLNVNSIMDKVFSYVSEGNSKALVNLLDKDYLRKNNITEENILTILSNYNDISSYFTKEIYLKEIAQRQNINGKYLYAKGIIRKNSLEEDIYLLIKQDLVNSTYSISILNKTEFSNKGKENEEITIAKNSYNTIYSNGISDYKLCFTYLNDYLNTVKNNPKHGYDLLDKEYRNKRFGSLENYIEYINSIETRLTDVVLTQHSVEKGEELTQYICVDQFGTYYIFNQQKMMNYTLMLDTYTIEQPNFLTKYNEANTIERAGYNIQKCIEAINNKDYNYVYNKLDKEFKNNNYNTIESLKTDIESKLFESNKVRLDSSLNEGYTYIYRLTIIDSQDNLKEQNMTFIMQLTEGTDFVMSFSFE